MIINMSQYGFWNSRILGQPLIPDYNLFWNCANVVNQDFPIEWGENNIYREPIFQNNCFRLEPNSPGVDQGSPGLVDIDESRSDIGAYGEPLAYP